MKKALITVDGRIVEVRDEVFPVHPSMQWVDVPDDTKAGEDRYVDGDVVKLVAPEPSPIQTIALIESAAPFTHRALREFFIGFGEAQPAFKDTLLYKRAKQVDDAIKVERSKL